MVKVFLKNLGPQSELDLSFVTNDNAISYLRDLEDSIKLS